MHSIKKLISMCGGKRAGNIKWQINQSVALMYSYHWHRGWPGWPYYPATWSNFDFRQQGMSEKRKPPRQRNAPRRQNGDHTAGHRLLAPIYGTLGKRFSKNFSSSGRGITQARGDIRIFDDVLLKTPQLSKIPTRPNRIQTRRIGGRLGMTMERADWPRSDTWPAVGKIEREQNAWTRGSDFRQLNY